MLQFTPLWPYDSFIVNIYVAMTDMHQLFYIADGDVHVMKKARHCEEVFALLKELERCKMKFKCVIWFCIMYVMYMAYKL